MYHTQEKRKTRLSSPKPCTRDDAWLGNGYYFWYDEIDAIHWGNNSKTKTGSFEIYKALINLDNILDTVFNEEHYQFWMKQIEKAAKAIIKITGKKPTLKEINQYFQERSKWQDITKGILFQDLPNSDDLLVSGLYYRKRIQLAAYDLGIVSEFCFQEEMNCN
ncbi:hypothetical protein SAMN05444362_1281 [Dysgonomonas macrotermitis]|uniref:Uncharacterized protein n=2 Tax=Dysgonomonas macrotermitis TaxID=1346286 RepID=A0A1M5JU16_9BACT|nr:hypothetical protein SAMN05444362_1281 [Dysgonomonas macrotermitis]